MCDSNWLFTEEQLANAGKGEAKISEEIEMFYRQDGAKMIQDMGQRLRVSQLCINSAIVYFHRFYVFHPFSLFHRHDIAATAFFLAAKVEEHPRKAIDVVKVLAILLEPYGGKKMKETEMAQKVNELVLYENFLTQTLGFDYFVVHPHVYVVQAFQNLRHLPGFEKMGKIFYFMATTTLHLTKMCLKYPSATVAAACIDITCRWLNYKFPDEIDGKPWYKLIDENVTEKVLGKLRHEFFAALDKSPKEMQDKIEAIMSNRKVEVPKPPVSYRKSSASTALQEKQTNLQKAPSQLSRQESSKSNKRPSQDQPKIAFKKASSSGNLEQSTSSKVHKQPAIPVKWSRGINSQSYTKFPSPLAMNFVRESSASSLESAEAPTSKKRKIESKSDGELYGEAERDSKMRKVDEFDGLPRLTERPNVEDESPPKTEPTAPAAPQNLMNVVNVKLTILPTEDAQYDQMYLDPSSKTFENDLFNFKQELDGTSDFNNNAEKISAGC